MANGHTIPGGKAKGTPLAEAQLDDLQYWSKRIGESLDKGESRNAARDNALYLALNTEIQKRGRKQEPPAAKETAKPGPAAPASTASTPGTSLAKPRSTEIQLSGSSRDATDITKRLEYAAKHYHLVSPAPACSRLPEGCSVTMSSVLVDAENETYDVGGKKLGLGKTALQRIGNAAGVSWDAQQSGRLDDSSDPHYCNWKAVGSMRHLDGTEVQLLASKEMDLREGSAQIEALRQRYEEKYRKWEKDGKQGWAPKDPSAQIREMRLHIQAHAETKAQLRAIRAVGIRSSYTREELQKPFIVARLQWTGESDDPALRTMFAEKTADAFLGGVRSLYGHQPPALPTHLEPTRTAPPPVDRSRAPEYDDYEDMEPVEPQAAPQAPVPAEPPPAKPAPAPSPKDAIDAEYEEARAEDADKQEALKL